MSLKFERIEKMTIKSRFTRIFNAVSVMSIGMMSQACAVEANSGEINVAIKAITKMITGHVTYGLPITGAVLGSGVIAFGLMKHQYKIAGTGAALAVIPAAFYTAFNPAATAMIP